MKTHKDPIKKPHESLYSKSGGFSPTGLLDRGQFIEIGQILRPPEHVALSSPSSETIQREVASSDESPQPSVSQFPGEDREMHDRRTRVDDFIPRAIQRIQDRLLRGSNGVFWFESYSLSTGLISSGGPGGDWPPETLYNRRQRLTRLIGDLGDVLDQLRNGPIPPGWQQRLEREAAIDPEVGGEYGGFGQVVEDVILFYEQVAIATGVPVTERSMNVFYFEPQPSAREHSSSYYPTHINIIVPDPAHPTRVIRVTPTADVPLLPENERTSESNITPVFRDNQGYFYLSSRGRIRLDGEP